MSVLTATDEELVASFPASPLNGTFLFTVFKGTSRTISRRLLC